MASESKRQRKPEEEEIKEDRISNLPDGVLLHILSRLPTKTAVTTSRLSHRWRHLWQHLSVLDFADDESHGCDQSKELDAFRSFAVLVNSVFLALHNPRGIRKMILNCSHSLFCDKYRTLSVESWVRAAIGPYLEELDLTLYACHHGSSFNLPQTLFTSSNLVSLSLYGEIDVIIQPSVVVSLPSLKTLQISMGYVEVSNVNALLCGCPIIESLNLSFSPQSLDKVCVPPSLRRLEIANEDEVGVYLEINAPDLEYLNITRITFGQAFSMYNLHNVVEAYLDVFPHSFGSVIPLHNLLGTLSGTKHLVLNPSTTKWLLGEPNDLLFQEFQYLLRLELNLPWFNSNSLLTLLQKCPMLQVLIIQNDKEQSPILGWATLPSVPNCLVSHLTFIQFNQFQGFPDEVSFVELVLQKGLVLKTMMIIADSSLDLKKKYDILQTLSDVPRASGMCQLKFE